MSCMIEVNRKEPPKIENTIMDVLFPPEVYRISATMQFINPDAPRQNPKI